jgi:hypothetical protein
MVFRDNPGWPFFTQLKWINSQISDCGMDSTEVPPAGQRQLTSTNTCFICHCPNQSGHFAQEHPKLSIGIQKTSAEASILCQMPFLMQLSKFPGLGLAPPMAPITVEA